MSRVPVVSRHVFDTARRSLVSASSSVATRRLTPKMFQEISQLHEEDPERWTAVTLSTRFAIPVDTVNAAMLLSTRGQKRRKTEVHARIAEAWSKISSPPNTPNRLRRDTSSEPMTESTEKLTLQPRFSIVDDKYAAAMESLQQRENAVGEADITKSETEMEAMSVESVSDAEGLEGTHASDEDDVGEKEAEEISDLQQWINSMVDDETNVDAIRQTTYAFMEAGRAPGEERAIWIRDGSTGRIRHPSDEERKHLSGGPQRKFRKPTRGRQCT